MYKRNVLLMGEDETSAAHLNEAPGDESIVSRSADDCDKAANMLQNGKPDLILMNQSLPKREKLELIRKIKLNYKKEVSPVMFITPNSESLDAASTYANLPYPSLNLPINPTLIVSKVKSYFNKPEEIENSYKRKLDNLRGNISLAIPHEFRTHLTGIVGFSKAISQIVESDERSNTENLIEISEMAKLILDSGTKLSRIAENFILYSQIRLSLDSDEEINELKNCKIDNTCEIIDEIIMTMGDKYDRKQDIISHIDECSLNISWYHFYKSIYEIIDNSLKFSQPGSTIKIFGVEKKDHFEVVILDEGRGMTSDQIDNIGAFSQFDRNKYEQQGAGLGLIIVKTLCRIYDAKFSIHSSLGKGTVVKLKYKLS